jgi:S-adenosylmethionine hydrolase
VNEPGIAVAFFNSQRLLEIAQNNSRGSQLFGLKVDGPVLIMER